MNGSLARIVPRGETGKGPMLTQGTEVFIGEQKLAGITRIELICDINDVWRARIDCMAEVPEIDGVLPEIDSRDEATRMLDAGLLRELKILRVKPDEMLVIECERMLHPDQRQRLAEHLKAAGVRAMILDGGLTVAAVQSQA